MIAIFHRGDTGRFGCGRWRRQCPRPLATLERSFFRRRRGAGGSDAFKFGMVKNREQGDISPVYGIFRHVRYICRTHRYLIIKSCVLKKNYKVRGRVDVSSVRPTVPEEGGSRGT